MARSTTTRFKRVATVVPLALVSAAWTTHLAGASPVMTAGTTAAPVADTMRTLPDGTRVPLEPLDYPASLSAPDQITAGDGGFTPVAFTAPTSRDIPPQALAAYQRAETVINAADPSCHLRWQLLAAVGRVESDHGRFAGATFDPAGRVTPQIIGASLDGRNGTAIIRDTDAGQYDGDSRYDRAVGPMQFIPSTWAVVGVDADNDGQRDPQDIDDAALAAAVYLCSGSEDLSSTAGQRPAVFRYNHSAAYVDLVLSIMNGYLQGNYSAVATSLISTRVDLMEFPVPTQPVVSGAGEVAEVRAQALGGVTTIDPPIGPGSPVRGAPAPAAPPSAPTPVDPPAEPTDPTEEPTDPTDPADPTDPTDPIGEPTDPTEGSTDPIDPPTEPTGGSSEPAGPPPSEALPSDEPAVGTLSAEDAALHCTDEGLVDDPALATDDHDTCVALYTVPVDGSTGPGGPGSPVLDTKAVLARD